MTPLWWDDQSQPLAPVRPYGPLAQQSPYVNAVVGLLAWLQHPAPAAAPPRHFGPSEGPLGENAHLGWGQKPKTTASPRKAAPTRTTKLGGVVGGASVPRSLLPVLPAASSGQTAVASVIRSLLSGATPRYV